MKNCMNCGNGPWRDGKEECRWCSWTYKNFTGDPTRWKPKENDMCNGNNPHNNESICFKCKHSYLGKADLQSDKCANCGWLDPNDASTVDNYEPKESDKYWATDRRKDFKTPCNQDCCDPGGAEKTEPTGGVYWEKPIEEPKTSDEHWERLSGLFTAMDLSKSQMIAGLWYLYKAALKHGRDE
jgi:hypothetical protein